jgi:hypothetical protein
VVAALLAFQKDQGAYAAALAALSESRVLVPVVAILGETAVDADGLTHDKTSDMAAVLLTGRDGRLALLAFTSLTAMAGWDPAARPVPVSLADAARAALADNAEALVIDVAGPVRFVIEQRDLIDLARDSGDLASGDSASSE